MDNLINHLLTFPLLIEKTSCQEVKRHRTMSKILDFSMRTFNNMDNLMINQLPDLSTHTTINSINQTNCLTFLHNGQIGCLTLPHYGQLDKSLA